MYNNILVIGASGKTGSRVAKKLQDKGVNVIAASRSSNIKFDWEDKQSWSEALKGADAAYVTYYPDLAVPGAPEDIKLFCELARDAGVKHLTLLSGRGEPAAQDCEDILKNSGLSWTIIRASWFNQNFSEGLFGQFIAERRIALPVDLVKEPFIDIDDIADIAILSFTEPGHSLKLYEVTGSELLSFKDLAERFSAHLGEKVSFEQVSLQAFQSNMQKLGVDSGAVAMLTYLFTEVLDGRNAHICDGVKMATGNAPRTFDQFILNNIHAFG